MFTENVHLSKEKSKRLICVRCPYCQYENICNQYSEDEDEKVCLDLSSDSRVIWVRISERKETVIKPPMRIGNIIVLKLHHVGTKSNKFYFCLVELEKGVFDYRVMRGDNLVRRLNKEAEKEIHEVLN